MISFEEYLLLVRDEINPLRVSRGLKPLTGDQARELHAILCVEAEPQLPELVESEA